MSSSALSDSTDTITNVVFGLVATIISVVTVWQGHRAWKIWHENHVRDQDNVAPDIELGLQPVQSTPTGIEASQRGEVVVPSAPSVDQTGVVAGSEHTSISTPSLELQPTPSPTIADATSPSPSLTQGAQIDDNDLTRVHTENVPPTDTERGDHHPAANDNHDDPAQVY